MEQPETPRDVWRQWEVQQASVIVESINHVRQVRGVSLRRLAELLEEVGWPIGFGTLAGILSSKKRAGFSVAEVFAFAQALAVPPGYLIAGLPNSSLPAEPVLPRSPGSGELLMWMLGETDSEGRLAVREEVKDEVTQSAMNAVMAVSEVARQLAEARWQNDFLVAVQRLGEARRLEDYFIDELLNGSRLRGILRVIQHDLKDIRQSSEPLWPTTMTLPAPFDVVTPDADLDELELPLPVPEDHDVSHHLALFEQVLASGPARRRSRNRPNTLPADGADA